MSLKNVLLQVYFYLNINVQAFKTVLVNTISKNNTQFRTRGH